MSPPPSPAPRLRCAIGNSKGGVGKTTTTIGLAVAGQQAGLRVLVFDGDPQGNASTYLTGLDVDELDKLPLWGSILTGENDISDVILSPATFEGSALDEGTKDLWRGVDLVPSSRSCAHIDKSLAAEDLWNERDALDEISNDYDLILIDCPPNLGSITLSHLYAADQALIVSDADSWGLDGIRGFDRTIRKVARSNAGLQLVGLVINQFDMRERAQRDYVEQVQEDLPGLYLDPPIPDRVAVKNAKNQNVPLTAIREPEARVVTERYASILTRLIDRPTGGK